MNRLADRRLSQAFERKAPGSEITAELALYKSRSKGWSVEHFCAYDRRDMQAPVQPVRSYSWAKTVWQFAGLVPKASAKGRHHKKRDPKPMEGMLVHQDASTHE